jgi:DNA polymerase-3 subunit epsilon
LGEYVDFIVIDVETANPDLGSICQVGIAVFSDGCLSETWSSFVNPDDYFDDYNVAVHGISSDMVSTAPNWPEIHELLVAKYSNRIVASHTPFDRTAVRRACERHEISPIECKWLDTARVVRRTWPQFSRSGYGLANLASHFGLSFKHHDAEEDARVAGEILLRSIEESGISVEEWCTSSLHRTTSKQSYVSLEANPEGPLFGSVVVFTGALSIPRNEAALLAAYSGCEIGAGVTKNTTLLVVGDQDIRALAGAEKSSKHRKAEQFIAKGQDIRIIGESDFEQLVHQ